VPPQLLDETTKAILSPEEAELLAGHMCGKSARA
jgi:hypothetical protein